MVGFEEHLIQIMSALTTDESHHQIIPIVGMGGIGKTTLAANVYNNPFSTEHFHIRVWVTLSQEYTVRVILLGLLHKSISTDPNEQERSENLATFTDKMRQKSDDKLREQLHKNLSGRKYLIVMDDMWNTKAWDKVRNKVGICSVKRYLHKKVALLNWRKLEQSIAVKCGGLPLALVVIDGVLARSKKTREQWEYVEEEVASAVNCENDEHCMKILSLSYSHLPIYLKPCFQKNIESLCRSSSDCGLLKDLLNQLWVKVFAEEYLGDLIDRNLILVSARGSSGKVKYYSIHDLVRDLCKREAHKDKFLRIAKLGDANMSPYIENERRLSIRSRNVEENVREALQSAAVLNRSLLIYSWKSRCNTSRRFRLLRVLEVIGRYSINDIPFLINSRYVACFTYKSHNFLPSSISRLWSLQTLVLDGHISLPVEIWHMPQLRHVKIKLVTLHDPPNDGQNVIVLENLQTLSKVEYFRCTEQILKRIPNVKKLEITYGHRTQESRSSCFSNLVLLHKLESFVLKCDKAFSRNITFPSSLKKLKLKKCNITWENMSNVGSLPNLEVLKLSKDAFIGEEWNPVEGEFCRLKCLMIYKCEFEIWGAHNTHFPSLEYLDLGCLMDLEEIPMGFAEIPTLQVIN